MAWNSATATLSRKTQTLLQALKNFRLTNTKLPRCIVDAMGTLKDDELKEIEDAQLQLNDLDDEFALSEINESEIARVLETVPPELEPGQPKPSKKKKNKSKRRSRKQTKKTKSLNRNM